ncbi:MAG TPA: hypothetical protein VFX59_11395 [Polyangiales bacterium]|nr:hypothetical protein [Polyangiales bacterium]
MRLRWWTCALWVACGDDEPVERDEAPAGALDGSVVLDATRPPRADTGVDAGPPTIASSASCTDSLEAPGALVCTQPDPTEPNDERHPATLLTDACASVVARAADKDEDAYRFTTSHADPVSIELLYRDEARADLALGVYSDNRLVARGNARRSSASELESVLFVTQPAADYDVRVEGTHVGTCVPYALRVNPSWCTDAYEDNDSTAKASPLDLTHGAVELDATGSRYEADYYAFSPSKADPVLVSGSYEVDASSNMQLRRVLSNVTGLNAIDDPGARTGTREEWQHWLRSDTPSYVVQIAPSGEGCVRYALRVDPYACTDSHEDNDTLSQAVPLPDALEASVFPGDDDFFTLPASSGGQCTLSYQADDAQQLRIDVFSTGSGVIASGLGKQAPGQAQTVNVEWTGVAAYLSVSARTTSCQPYRLRCTTSPR